MPEWRWVSADPVRDGSGLLSFDGTIYRIVRQKGPGFDHRVAFIGMREVARAGRFTTLLKKLAALAPASGEARPHKESDNG